MTADGPHSHDYHVMAQQPHAERIRWLPPQRLEDRTREVRTTCRCRAIVYTLVSGGGQMHIRREDHDGQLETYRMPTRAAEELWDRLLLGKAV